MKYLSVMEVLRHHGLWQVKLAIHLIDEQIQANKDDSKQDSTQSMRYSLCKLRLITISV